jgi:hypothetical protein
MAVVPQVGDLQIDEDVRFSERSWTVQRIAWVAMAAIIIGAMLGLLGPGWLSHRQVGGLGDPVQLSYHRLARWQTSTSLTVELTPLAARDGVYRFWLSREFIAQANIDRVTPPPLRVETGADRQTFFFAADPATSPTTITVHLEPEQVGRVRGQAGLDDGEPLTFDLWVLP